MLFEDERWAQVRSSAPVRSWYAYLSRQNFPCRPGMHDPAGVDATWDLVALGTSGEVGRDQMRELTIYLAPSLRSVCRDDVLMEDRHPLACQWAPVSLSRERV